MKITATKGPDKIEVEILDDGSLKISTGRISMANHGGAEILLKQLLSAAGGSANRVKNPQLHSHSHEGEHEHE